MTKLKTDNLSSARKPGGKTWDPTKTLHNNSFHDVQKNNKHKISSRRPGP